MVQTFVARDSVLATSVLWRRLRYQLSPQLDLYEQIGSGAIGRRVLDVGFGTGLGALQFYRAQEIVAIELDQDAVEFARRALPVPNIRWLHADVADFSDLVGFDLVTMIEVLEHVPEVDRVLTSCRDLLKLSGTFIVTAPNANRNRKKSEPLNNHEWEPLVLADMLADYFDRVELLNWRLDPLEDEYGNETPIICRCS